MIFVSSAALAQTESFKKNNLLLSLQPAVISWQFSFYKKSSTDSVKQKPFLAADFYSKQLGFFCRQEIKMDKLTKIPFRFRLGSVEQCDWLEGKRR
jgi:hypothetical protein